MKSNLTPEQRVQKAVIKIMAHQRYIPLGGVMLIGNRVVKDNIPTACTDGKNEFYGRDFISTLNDKELRFLILHEVYHKVYRHLIHLRWLMKKNPKLANMAMDYAINTQLVGENREDNFAKMTGPLSQGCYDKKYIGWDTVSIFNDLMRQGGGQGQGFDDHDWENAQQMGDEERRALEEEIDNALRQGVMAAGKLGSGGDRRFDELLKPQKNYRDVMREFITSTCKGNDYSTWNRVNRRYVGMGVYMPGAISQTIGEVLIGVDMSASIGQAEVTRMLSEVKGLAETVKPDGVRLVYWDTQVCADEKYSQDQLDIMIQSTKPKGGGGTDVCCVSDYMKSNNITPQCVVILTDGYLSGSWGSWRCPVLWIIVDNPNCSPPLGKVVHVNSKTM